VNPVRNLSLQYNKKREGRIPNEASRLLTGQVATVVLYAPCPVRREASFGERFASNGTHLFGPLLAQDYLLVNF